MKITLPMYFFTTTNLLSQKELNELRQKWEHCAFFIISGLILGVACAERENVIKIIEDLQSLEPYKGEQLDPNSIERY